MDSDRIGDGQSYDAYGVKPPVTRGDGCRRRIPIEVMCPESTPLRAPGKTGKPLSFSPTHLPFLGLRCLSKRQASLSLLLLVATR